MIAKNIHNLALTKITGYTQVLHDLYYKRVTGWGVLSIYDRSNPLQVFNAKTYMKFSYS